MQNKTMQTKGFARLLALLLCAAMLLPLPVWEAEASSAAAHGITTMDKVLFRKEALDGADHYGYLSIGQVMEVLGTATGSGRTWYKVKGEPITPKITYIGYVREDVFRPLTAQEEANFASTGSIAGGAVVTPSVTGSTVTAAPGSAYTTGYVRITQMRTNLRNKPDGSSFLQLDKNVILPCYGEEIVMGAYRWIYVLDTKTNNYGYVRSDCYKFVDASGNPTAGPGTGGAVPIVTSAPKTGNYAIVTVDAANLRQTPGGSGIVPMKAGSVISITGSENSGWYPAQYNGYTGYVSASHIRFMTAAELAAYLGDGVVPGTPGTGTAKGYVRITAVRVNLRDKPDGSSLLQMDKDQVIPCYGDPQYKNGVAWQYVYYTPARVYGYVHQDFYKYTDENGNAAATATPAPLPTTPGESISGYVKLTKSGVNLRQTPGGESLTQLPLNTLLPFEGAPVYSGGYSWVKVTEPVTRRTGYVRSDCYQYVDASGNPTAQPTSAPTSAPLPSAAPTAAPGAASGTLTLIKGGVNLRLQPSGGIIARLDKGTTLNYYGMTQQDGYTWYYVQSSMGYGYIRGDMANVTPAGGTSPAPSTAPGAVYGYLITIKSNVNLRKLPDGLTLIQVPKAKVYPIVSAPVYKGGYNWFFVQAEGHTGYLRGDCARLLNAAETAAYLKDGTIPPLDATTPSTPIDGTVGHIITTMNAVNVRVSPSLDASVTAQVNLNTVLPYKTVMTAGGNTWYQVVYNGVNAYVLSSTARIMTAAEYEAWLKGQPVPTPTATPKPEELSNVAVTVMDKVLLRREGSMSAATLTVLYKAGTRVDLLGGTAAKDGYNWYSVRGANVTGWVRADMLRILSKTEAGSGSSSTPGGTDKPIVTYRTLRKGMSGTDVTALQNALIQLGLLPSGSATGVYTTQTEEAVREYQKAANLFVDGVAGQKTQNALYNTSAPNEGGGSTVDTTIYPVEIVDWYTGDIQSVWGKGVTATVTDVRTGISFRARRWSGGYHADVEPLTAADTAAMCRIYGVSRAQEISDKNLYQRRPLWVTLSGRTFAASMYGVPHNYPQGDTISDNDYYGQFCVHFYNSRTHSSGRVDSDHMAAIRYAYDNAPSKK